MSCLLGVQADLLDLLPDAHGTPFLFVSSLYCAQGKDGFYAEEGKGHLQFLGRALPAELGIALRCRGAGDTEETLARLPGVIQQAGPVVLPVNLKLYPGYVVQHAEDLAYPLIVLERGADSVVVYDNLRRGRPFESPDGWEGTESVLALEDLSRMMASYEEGDLGVEWMGGTNRTWLLTVERVDLRGVLGQRDPTGWIVRRYRDAAPSEPAEGTSAPVETRHWEAILRLAARDPAAAQERVRQYLLETKLAAFHVDLLLRTLAHHGREAHVEEVVSLQATKASLRTRCLVDALAGRLEARDLDDVRSRFEALDAAVRSSLFEGLHALGEPG